MKIYITGYSSAQHNKGKNRKNIIMFCEVLRRILLDNGHQLVDELDDADKCIVFLNPLNSLNTTYAMKSLDVLKNYDSIIAFDDWNIKCVYSNIKALLSGQTTFKSHPHYKQSDVEQRFDVLKKINDGDFKVLFGAYKAGNHDLLNIIGDKVNIDYSAYIERTYVQPEVFNYKPIYAGLAKKDNFIAKLDYDCELIEKQTEDYVFQKYCSNRLVVNPPHYHDGSGWIRMRYTLAYWAKALILEDMNCVFGEAYRINYDDEIVNDIDEIYEIQKSVYEKSIMTKEEISKQLNNLLNG